MKNLHNYKKTWKEKRQDKLEETRKIEAKVSELKDNFRNIQLS